LHQVGDLFELNVKLRCQKLIQKTANIALFDNINTKDALQHCTIYNKADGPA